MSYAITEKPALSHQDALNVLLNYTVVEASHAQELLSLAQKFGRVQIPRLTDGPHYQEGVQLTVIFYKRSFYCTSEGFHISITEVTNY